LVTQIESKASFTEHNCALFNITPAPIWKEDWTEVKRFCDEMRAAEITDLRRVLESDLDLLRKVISLIEVVDVNPRAVDFVGATDAAELVGRLPGELLNDGSVSALLDQIMVVWEGKSHLQCDISGVDMGGSDIECQLDWATPVVNREADYSQVVILIRDVSQHRAAERRTQKNVSQLETLLDMGRAIASTFDIDVILQVLADVSAELMGADQSLILLFDTTSEVITKRVTHGTYDTALPEPTFSEIMNRLPGWVTRNRTATLTTDLAADERDLAIPRSVEAVFSGRAAAVAPIIVDDLVLGTLTVMTSPDEPPFTDIDLSLVRMLAMQAAVAIRNAGLYEDLRRSRDRVEHAHEELKDTQTQLLQAQKLEAIGSLAAGIAHEINTPIQYVSDNTSFIKDAIGTLAEVAAAQWQFLDKAAEQPELAEEVAKMQALWKEKDCEFLLEEIPDAADETIEGARRVAEIVRAMKEFAHPGEKTKSDVNINRVIETTVQVSRNEWKYVADLELDLDDTIPMIQGHAGPLGQILLIMFVNSAQAMAEHRDSDSRDKGTIRVTTSESDGIVEIRIADDGPGIPQAIVDRIFDPFFTTKDVGKGSGQGLSIARSVVVDKHQGEIWVENANPGAVFVIRLPVKDPKKAKSPTNKTDA
jgi:signal transduction histidine kinase